MHSIEEQLRYFAVKVNNGSGCIFQPHTTEYTYVLTVKHNLIEKKGKYVAQIFRYNLEAGSELTVKSIYIHPDSSIDLALIVVEYIGDSDFHLAYSKHERNEIVTIFGYPKINNKDAIKTNHFECTCGLEVEEDKSFRITSNHSLFTFNKSTAENVIGFSGSGLFLVDGENVVLKGIFPQLNSADGAFHALLAYQIECYDEIIDLNSLQKLMPEFLINFKHVKNLAFHSIEPHISSIFNDNLEKIINSSISPNQIAELFKGSLYVPYTLNYRNKVINKALWKGWLELLTVLSIIADNNEDQTDDVTLLKLYLNKVNLLFSIDDSVLSILIKEIISDVQLKRLLIEDVCIVINSTNEPARKVYNKKSIQRILPNIAKASQFDRRIKIDESYKKYSFSCLHLSHFLNEIGIIEQDVEDDNNIDINKIRSIIQKIMKDLND